LGPVRQIGIDEISSVFSNYLRVTERIQPDAFDGLLNPVEKPVPKTFRLPLVIFSGFLNFAAGRKRLAGRSTRRCMLEGFADGRQSFPRRDRRFPIIFERQVTLREDALCLFRDFWFGFRARRGAHAPILSPGLTGRNRGINAPAHGQISHRRCVLDLRLTPSFGAILTRL
jgi:hypothetical protein